MKENSKKLLKIVLLKQRRLLCLDRERESRAKSLNDNCRSRRIFNNVSSSWRAIEQVTDLLDFGVCSKPVKVDDGKKWDTHYSTHHRAYRDDLHSGIRAKINPRTRPWAYSRSVSAAYSAVYLEVYSEWVAFHKPADRIRCIYTRNQSAKLRIRNVSKKWLVCLGN